jgi:uncharacterized protein (TIGR02271 family)
MKRCFHQTFMEEITLPEQHDSQTLQLHKEELQISKKWVDTADVKIYKNTYKEEKQITVPITREELVIEKKKANPQGTFDGEIETIQIPLSEECIEITKHPVILEDVEIYKNQLEEIVHVNETVKEEKLHIHTNGDIMVHEQ